MPPPSSTTGYTIDAPHWQSHRIIKFQLNYCDDIIVGLDLADCIIHFKVGLPFLRYSCPFQDSFDFSQLDP